jgi:hypothetical protein
MKEDMRKLSTDIHNQHEENSFLCVITPLSAIFQLYRDDQFSWWKKPEYPERTTDNRQETSKLYHLWLRVECTLFVIYKAGANPRRTEFSRRYLDIL